jgi:RsiW-degrading membrane proteinase PrsW (M82 family)
MSLLLTQAAHWGLALVPVLLLLAVFVWLDAFKLMSFREILLLLLAGGVGALAAWPVAGRMLDALPIGFSNYSRFVAPWIEEAIKAVIIIVIFRMNRIGYKLDAVISGFAIGAGFSVVENIFYLIRLPDFAAGTWLVRGVGTAVMHGTTLAIVAATAHEFAERETREAAGDFDFHLWWFVPGYLVAVALHVAFNQFPDRPLISMMGAIMFAPIALVAIFNFGTTEAQEWLTSESAAHRLQLETLRSGQLPDTPNRAKIEELCRRLGPSQAEHIRR